ncbi:DNA cytosine methyltransferase [Bradyrhizobium sp. AZCC 2289]|uniref:DNA cytosine methyltransferase n=1 Tax=Bradyrhizobium sp. AZCC 2289 TaxID=3117026 RepID=UPI003FA5B705
MAGSPRTIPIIDIFAGPGGLSEGFHSANTAQYGLRFSSVLSIEKDPVACETLRLRSSNARATTVSSCRRIQMKPGVLSIGRAA